MKKLKIISLSIFLGYQSFGQSYYGCQSDTSYTDSTYSIINTMSVFNDTNKLDFSIIEHQLFYLNGVVKKNSTRMVGQGYQGSEFGRIVTYYSNGQLKESYHSFFGIMVGSYIEFYENGQLKTVGSYIGMKEFDPNQINNQCDTIIKVNPNDAYDKWEDIICNTIQIKQGKWEYFDYKKRKVKCIWYDDNEILKVEEKEIL